MDRTYRYRRTHHLVDATPYTRVLGDLYRRGESIQGIAQVCGLNWRTVAAVVFAERERIQVRTARHLARAVEMFPTEEANR